jgi:hypothetical protein
MTNALAVNTDPLSLITRLGDLYIDIKFQRLLTTASVPQLVTANNFICLIIRARKLMHFALFLELFRQCSPGHKYVSLIISI